MFQETLAKDPADVDSMEQIAGIYFRTRRLDEAKAWYKRALRVDEHNPEAACGVGEIDLTIADENALKAFGFSQLEG